MRRSGCITHGCRGEPYAGKMTGSGCTPPGFHRADCATEIRWLGCIIHEFCGAVHGSDDLEMIWR